MQSHEKNRENTPAPEAGTTDELLVHVPARWGDMDAYGHVNNVAILSVMEEARVALFGPPPSSGQKPTVAPQPPIPLFDLVAEGVQALIAEHGIRYLAQLPYTGEPVPVPHPCVLATRFSPRWTAASACVPLPCWRSGIRLWVV